MDPQDQPRSVYDVYLPYLPEQEELDRLDSLLTEMLARARSELDRLTAPSASAAPA